MGGPSVWLLGGCASHSHKSQSYDRMITDESKDPTFRADPQRAGEEVRYVQ
jgi:hypothetical protein